MHFHQWKRRSFITLLGGAAAAWPLAARAQQGEQVRRIGVLMNLAADDTEGQSRLIAFVQGLQQLGWSNGRNMRIDTRWATGDTSAMRKYAAELVALAPDIILASSIPAVEALQRATRTEPIVFVNVTDPVGAGVVDSMAQPGGNTTGFTFFEYGISGKWLELLKEIAPQLRLVAVLRSFPATATGIGQWAVIQAAAPSVGVEVSPVNVRDADSIERAVTAVARSSNGGLIVTASTLAAVHRNLIIALAARHRLPAVYALRYFATSGGLISYGPDTIDPFRRAAGYVESYPQGREAGRSASTGADQVRTGDQSENGEGARLGRAAIAAGPRRRGDRVKRREFITRQLSLALFMDAKLDLGHKPARAKTPA
jgi:putative ABC transport system substrate-binding protein